ncbi:MAG: gliding motility-associated C-terminal domain-containing protein [Bacteroidetes bacterium]|nr:gliding motility-associated C-terminal domain-containing protein [Bacteroidota bacterium]
MCCRREDTITPQVSLKNEKEIYVKKNKGAGGRILPLFFLLSFLFFFNSFAHAQNPICGAGTPTFNVNLSSSVNTFYISPNVVRNDTCCGASNPDVCVHFIITLNPAATGIIFNIYSGAVPPGALYYQINCGPPVPVGQPICLTGPGPYDLTFCKPGNNPNQFIITSIPNISVSNNITVDDGCSGTIFATGYDVTTITWTSVYPSTQGAYNSYLSCTSGCDTVQVTGAPGMPSYVDYMVCGLPAGGCDTVPYCDTVRVYFDPTLAVNITPLNPTVCFGNTGTTITANGTGGAPPYTYLWSTGAVTQSIFVGAGTYSVTISDTTNCPAATATVTVTAFNAVITANAGADIMICASSPVANLNGSVTGVTTGVWSGGTGIFSPSNTSLNATYSPSANEITNGVVTLTLTTTNNGTCPPDSDAVTIFINDFTAIIDPMTSNVTCNGFNNGSATVNISGGSPPFTYSWSTVPIQTTSTAINLSPGTYTCTITDAHGCTGTATVQITQPPPIVLNAAGFATTCYNTCNGQAVVIPSGGSGGFSYVWLPGNITTAAATNLCPGTYTVTVTDINGCNISDTAIVGQPPQLIITSITSGPAYCNHASGTTSVTATGGSGSYSYLWNPTSQTTNNATSLFPGSYSVTVTDGNGCTASASITVTNTPGVTLSVTSVNSPLCNASCNGSATVNASGGYPNYQYTWSTNPVQNSFTANNLCAGTYNVIVTDSYNCSDSLTVQLTSPPPLTLSTGAAPIICIGQSYTMTAAASGGTPGYNYSWSPNGPTVSPSVTTTYTVVATDANGCQSSPQQITVQVYPAVTAAISGNQVVCNNTTANLTASAAGGIGGPYTYTWQPGNLNGISIQVHPVSTITYTVTVSDGCSPSATATFTITVPPAPVASFSYNDTAGCGQVCADFINTTPNLQSSLWLYGDGNTSTVNNPTHCFLSGTWPVTLISTDNNGCRDTVTIPNAIIVHSNPTADFILGPQPTTILEPNICFTDQSSSDVISWYWNFDDPNDQATSTDQNTCHVYSDTGTYCASLIVTNQYGCWSTEMNCLMIKPYYSIYVPNAFTPNGDGMNDIFLPVGNDVDPDYYELTIYDRWGNLLFKTNSWGEGWNGTVKGGSKIAQIDTYVWKINCKDREGQRHNLIGKVSIIK